MAIEKRYKLCPTIYGSLAKDLWLLEELMLIWGFFFLSFAQERNCMVLTKLLPKLFFFAISITWQNLLMFSVMIIHDDDNSGADGVDGRAGDQFYRVVYLSGSVHSLLHCSSDKIETWCVMWLPKAILPVGGKSKMQTLSDFNPTSTSSQ